MSEAKPMNLDVKNLLEALTTAPRKHLNFGESIKSPEDVRHLFTELNEARDAVKSMIDEGEVGENLLSLLGETEAAIATIAGSAVARQFLCETCCNA